MYFVEEGKFFIIFQGKVILDFGFLLETVNCIALSKAANGKQEKCFILIMTI